ncbi:hypothetical protein SDRG_01387 [Saprolegnia diclina VS20]|uniref:Uncharacterized protein n=1 Tax=Saprolegnia diclina (strain VS20) TaxID=1156394 RepID=T0S860_SAPDV|nr:hypothetical protein SDRG_01387 [Saprolegnia diclina VS20]EQC41418.1 hypothetical protein SDRG_01387 [Saprolegnia diclina VS20]|eukprot:XP_008605132.1 hypothetical protein SDRG_01387 [Saprolegnia diclina VS20]
MQAPPSLSVRPASFNRIKTILDIRNAKKSIADHMLAIASTGSDGLNVAPMRQLSALKLKQSVMSVMLAKMAKTSSLNKSSRPLELPGSIVEEAPAVPEAETVVVASLEVEPRRASIKEKPPPHAPLSPEMNPLNFEDIARPVPKNPPELLHQPSLITPKLIDAADHVDEIRQAVIRLVAEGEVVTALDPGASVSYDHQGDLKFYTDDNLQKRLELRYHPLLCRMTRVFWLTMVKPDADKMEFDDYQRLFLRIHKVLIELFDLGESRIMIADDWKRDIDTHTNLEYEMFHLSLFELIDIWCDSLDADDYCNLLYLILNGITHRQSGSFRLRRLEEVAYIDVAEAGSNISSPLIASFLDEVEKAQLRKYRNQTRGDGSGAKPSDATSAASGTADGAAPESSPEQATMIASAAEATTMLLDDDEALASLRPRHHAAMLDDDAPLAKTLHAKLKMASTSAPPPEEKTATMYHPSHPPSFDYDPHMDLGTTTPRRVTKRPSQATGSKGASSSNRLATSSSSQKPNSSTQDRRPTGSHAGTDATIVEDANETRRTLRASSRVRSPTLRASTGSTRRSLYGTSDAAAHHGTFRNETQYERIEGGIPTGDAEYGCNAMDGQTSGTDDVESPRDLGGRPTTSPRLSQSNGIGSGTSDFGSAASTPRGGGGLRGRQPSASQSSTDDNFLLTATGQRTSFTRGLDPAHFRPKDELTTSTAALDATNPFAVKSLGLGARIQNALAKSPRYIGEPAEDASALDWASLGIGGARIQPVHGKVSRLNAKVQASPRMADFVVVSQSVHPPRIQTAPEHGQRPQVSADATSVKCEEVLQPASTMVVRANSGRHGQLLSRHVAKKANEMASMMVHELASKSIRGAPTAIAKPTPPAIKAPPSPRGNKEPPTLYKIGVKRPLPTAPHTPFNGALESHAAGRQRASRPSMMLSNGAPAPSTRMEDDSSKTEMLFRVTALGSPTAKPAFAVAADSNLQVLVRQPTKGMHDVFKVTGVAQSGIKVVVKTTPKKTGSPIKPPVPHPPIVAPAPPRLGIVSKSVPRR